MTFQTPLALLALGLVPLMLVLYALAQRRSRRYAVRFPGAATLARLAPDSRWRRHLPAGLFLIGLAAALVSLARPEATIAVPVERASVMLVTDGSGSMRATDVSPTRLDAARAAARGFLDDVPDELQVGFVGFSDGAHSVVPPATERAEVRTALEALAADGGTATGDALRAALDALPQPEGDGERPPAAIVLLSDGQHTAGADPLEVAREAAAEQVPVFTVALGTPGGVVDTPMGGRLRVPPDPETMREIAAITGGEAFAAEDAGELGAVYDRLGSQIGTRDEQREITAGFAAGALALLAAALVTSLRRFGRLP
jgi:Ca-activated chloride channel family protein